MFHVHQTYREDIEDNSASSGALRAHCERLSKYLIENGNSLRKKVEAKVPRLDGSAAPTDERM